jgi:hypothetical protein
MPYQTHSPVSLGDVQYPRGAVVSDAVGEAIIAEHGSPDIVRIGHDDDLCSAMVEDPCTFPSHSWNAVPPAPAVVPVAPIAAPKPAPAQNEVN